MIKISCLAALCLVVFSTAAFAQENESQPQNYLGFNVAEPLIVWGISRVYSLYDVDTTYLPITVNYAHAFNKNWGFSSQLVYRYEKYHDNYLINELGFGIGPRFSLNFMKGFFAEIKIGAGFAFGRDFDGYAYSRLDIILQPEVGFNIAIGDIFTLTVGGGLQSLLPLYEWNNNPYSSGIVDRWTWTGISYAILGMAHLCMPVLNVSAAIVF